MQKRERQTFGSFLRSIRLKRHKTLCETARRLKVSPQYYSEVERDRRTVLTAERLKSVKEFLMLEPEESEMLFDLAAQARNNRADIPVPQDFADYISDNCYVSEALRVARDSKAGREEWTRFMEELRENAK